ncbi:MAG TPA: glycosyltransferase family 2 protein [Azospirillum sp.]|nr:glycosyltransferase family 2 protein [Azospirillum sp.]
MACGSEFCGSAEPIRYGGQLMINPQISVVIAAYNSEKCIFTAIESAVAQKNSSIEVLIVDDGSSDDTAEVAQRFVERDDRVTLLRNEANLGPAATRNRAISAARGAWIAPLDADDWYDPDRLGFLLRHAERTGADLIADNLLVHDEASGTTKLAFPAWPDEPFGPVPAIDICRQDWPNTGPMGLGYAKPLIRRDFLLRAGLGYAEDIRIGEDFDLYMRCLMHGARLFFVNRPLYHYTRRWGSLSKSDDGASYRDFIRVNQRLLDRARVQQDRALVRALSERQVHLESHLSFMAFREAWQQKDFGRSFRSFRQIPSYRYAVSRLAGAGYRRIKDWVLVKPGSRLHNSGGGQA